MNSDFYVQHLIANEVKRRSMQRFVIDATQVTIDATSGLISIPDNESWILTQNRLPQATAFEPGDEYTLTFNSDDNQLSVTPNDYDMLELYKYQMFTGTVQYDIVGVAPLPLKIEFLKVKFE